MDSPKETPIYLELNDGPQGPNKDSLPIDDDYMVVSNDRKQPDPDYVNLPRAEVPVRDTDLTSWKRRATRLMVASLVIGVSVLIVMTIALAMMFQLASSETQTGVTNNDYITTFKDVPVVGGVCSVTAGGGGGTHFSDELFSAHGRIRLVEIGLSVYLTEKHVAGIRTKYGSRYTIWRGTYRTTEYMDLDQNEVITNVTIYSGDVHGDDVVVGLRFQSNMTKDVMFGDETEKKLRVDGDELLYFSGSIGSLVDRLSLHFRHCIAIS